MSKWWVTLEVTYLKETDDAGVEVWVPRSQIRDEDAIFDFEEVTIPHWLARNEGLM